MFTERAFICVVEVGAESGSYFFVRGGGVDEFVCVLHDVEGALAAAVFHQGFYGFADLREDVPITGHEDVNFHNHPPSIEASTLFLHLVF